MSFFCHSEHWQVRFCCFVHWHFYFCYARVGFISAGWCRVVTQCLHFVPQVAYRASCQSLLVILWDLYITLLLLFWVCVSGLTLREKRRLRVLENWASSIDCRINRSSQERWDNWVLRGFMIRTAGETSLSWLNGGDWGGRGLWHVCGRGEVHTGLLLGEWRKETAG